MEQHSSWRLAAGASWALSPAGTWKRSGFDPSKTWRHRRREEIRALSAIERRYLLYLLAQIEASRGTLSNELFISARRMAGTGSRRLAEPLALIVERGVLVLSTKDVKLRGFVTEDSRQLIHRWFAAQPPDFIKKRFPWLYRELGLCGDEVDGAAAKQGVRRTESRGKNQRCRLRPG